MTFNHSVIYNLVFAFPLFNPSNNTHALHISLLLTNPQFTQVLFSGGLTSLVSIFSYSAEWIISTIDDGLTFSKSFINSLTYPLYALGEYIHSVEK